MAVCSTTGPIGIFTMKSTGVSDVSFWQDDHAIIIPPDFEYLHFYANSAKLRNSSCLYCGSSGKDDRGNCGSCGAPSI